MSRYRLVIFDLDGTLSDSFAWFLSVVNTVADKHGFARIENEDVETLRAKGSRELIKLLKVSRWKLPRIANDMRKLKSASIGEIRLFPGTSDALARLARTGIKLAVVSSDSEDNVRAALGMSALNFSYFACGASLFGKAAKFKKVMKLSGIPSSQVLSVGDEVRDAEASAKAGIAFGAVSWGYARLEALQRHHPEVVFNTVEEIVSLACPSLAPL